MAAPTLPGVPNEATTVVHPHRISIAPGNLRRLLTAGTSALTI
jgi:hypothetical protein